MTRAMPPRDQDQTQHLDRLPARPRSELPREPAPLPTQLLAAPAECSVLGPRGCAIVVLLDTDGLPAREVRRQTVPLIVREGATLRVAGQGGGVDPSPAPSGGESLRADQRRAPAEPLAQESHFANRKRCALTGRAVELLVARRVVATGPATSTSLPLAASPVRHPSALLRCSAGSDSQAPRPPEPDQPLRYACTCPWRTYRLPHVPPDPPSSLCEKSSLVETGARLGNWSGGPSNGRRTAKRRYGPRGRHRGRASKVANRALAINTTSPTPSPA